jgi:hypothetical protein
MIDSFYRKPILHEMGMLVSLRKLNMNNWYVQIPPKVATDSSNKKIAHICFVGAQHF